MFAMAVAGCIMAMATLMALARFDMLKVLGYSAVVDFAFTVLLFALFSETYSGIIASAFAGVFMSLMLYILRATMGCKKLKVRNWRLQWVYFDGKQYRQHWVKGLIRNLQGQPG